MAELPIFLNRLFDRYHRREFLTSDPLEFPHRYSDPLSQEAVALVSALMAYGNVKQIRRSAEDLLSRMAKAADSPADYVRRMAAQDLDAPLPEEMKSFVHRFNRGDDFVLLLRLLGRSWKIHGSLGAHFVACLGPEDGDITQALNALIAEWRSWAGPRRSPGFAYLLNAPVDGSCCKRWCLFLRWMGRSEGGGEKLDLGLWAEGGALTGAFPAGRVLKSSQLILPLDTHTGRISQYLDLTRRKSLGWKAAQEITRSLKACDPEDPTRYDFALSRLGILSLCKNTYRAGVCEKCDLVRVCKFGKRARNAAK